MKNWSTLVLAFILSSVAWASYVIPDGAVTTAKLASGAVTRPKLAALGQQTATPGSFQTASTSFVDATGYTVTLITTGRPVWVGLISTSSTACAMILQAAPSNTTQVDAFIQYVRDGSTTVGAYEAFVNAASSTGIDGRWPCGAAFTIDTGASAGSHTYKIQMMVGFANNRFTVNGTLIAYEM